MKAKMKRYQFFESEKNVYGEYLHATYIRQNRWPWMGALAIFIAILVWSIYVVLNPEIFGESYAYPDYAPTTIRKRFASVVAVPLAWISIPLFIFLTIVFVSLLFFKGYKFADYAWPKFFARQCARETRQKFINAGKTYFNTMERYPMKASFGEDSIEYTKQDGSQESMRYDTISQAFRGDGLIVLHSGPPSLPTGEVILDLREIPKKEQKDLMVFLDGLLPKDCKCYYRRKAQADYMLASSAEGTRDE